MIHNDPRRIVDFFQQPTQAGRAARELPLSNYLILLLIAGGILISQITAIFSHSQSKAYLEKMRAAQPAPLNDAEASLQQYVESLMDTFMSNPLLIAVLSFFSSLVLMFLMVKISRAFGNLADERASYSALARVFFVRNLALAILSFLIGFAFLLSENLGSAVLGIVSLLSLVVLIWTIFMIKGALDLKSFLGTLGIGLLSLLALSMIVMVFLMFFGGAPSGI